MQVKNQRIFGLFSAAWITGYASRKSKNFQTFFGSMVIAGVKSKIGKKEENLHIFLGASAADDVIKICPQRAGNGPVFDYAMGPEPGWRWGRPLRRDRAESAQTKPACAAGDLCVIRPPRGGRSVRQSSSSDSSTEQTMNQSAMVARAWL